MLKKLQLDKAKNIDGWMSELELQFLAECAAKSKIVFEIGSYRGRSARAMADNSGATIYCIDPWGAVVYNEKGVAFYTDMNTYGIFYANLYSYIKAGRVIPVISLWEEYEPPCKADFIFIDGDHRYSAVKTDIDKALKYINPGGIIAGHDFEASWVGVVKAVEETFPKFDLTDTIWSVHA